MIRYGCSTDVIIALVKHNYSMWSLYFYFSFLVVCVDENCDRVQDTNDSGFPNVPTAVSLIAQEAAAEDASTNDSDTELASKVLSHFTTIYVHVLDRLEVQMLLFLTWVECEKSEKILQWQNVHYTFTIFQ